MNQNFTETIIRGIKPTTTLPPKTALVLEGGGIRGFYSSGVFEAFMDAEIMFPYIVGVSAGAANALSYISGQRGRSRQIVEKYVGNKKYVSYGNMLKHRSVFGFDYIFKTIPDNHIFWDRENFHTTDIRFLTGATDCETGECVWFEKDEMDYDFIQTRASCSIPFLSKIVKIGEHNLVDGAVSVPIPIEKSIEDGNNFHVIVLTRNNGYIKTPSKLKFILKLFYNKYPKLVEKMLVRHNDYNRQVALCEQLERDGKALIIRPQKPLMLDRLGSNIEKLLALYDDGEEDGKTAINRLKERFTAVL